MRPELADAIAEIQSAEKSCALELFESELSALTDRLRETAAELRAGTINRHHAANRIEKIANQIAKKEK